VISDELKKEILDLKAVTKLVTPKLIHKIKNKKLVKVSNKKPINNQFPKIIYNYFGFETRVDKVDKSVVIEPIATRAVEDESQDNLIRENLQNAPISQPHEKKDKTRKKYSNWKIFTTLVILLILICGILIARNYNLFRVINFNYGQYLYGIL
jgi:hypothetical protein